jgi:Phosphotransferase enzyme family
MPVQETIVETTEYRLLLLLPESRKILVVSGVDGYRLPSIGVPQWTRHADQLRRAIQMTWKLCVFVLDFLPGLPPCAVVEVFDQGQFPDLRAVSLETLQTSELTEEQRAQIASILGDDTHAQSPFTRVGWIYEAIAWLESETGRKLSSMRDIEQCNAGSGFALVRFRTEDECAFWLKATGEPNIHERSITTLLSKLCGRCLPELISSKPEWNAWLMSGEATCLEEIPTGAAQLLTLLKGAVECMAELQIKTQGHSLELLEAGAFDQGLQVFENHAKQLFDFLEEAMSLQTSTKAPRLEKTRIRRLLAIFEEVCKRVEDLAIPETIVHGDMNRGNILSCGGHCQFIDWSEAYFGNPLITLEHLLLFNKLRNGKIRNFVNSIVKQKYLSIWTASCSPASLNEGFVYMSFLAVASALYGRGNWLNTAKRNDPRRRAYARSLARYMDRAAREPEFLEAICH